MRRVNVGPSSCIKFVFICFNDSPLKKMKNDFYFMFLRYLYFCPDCLVMKENGLIIKLKSYDVTDWTTKIAIHILLNISRSKGNQRMKFGQLLEYSKRNIFLEKSYTKCDGEDNPRPFYKNSKLSISLDQQCKVL